MRDLFPGNRHIYKSSSSQEDFRRMTNDNDKLLTAGQVAEMFQLPRCTIYGWVHKKRIKVLKLSRKMIRFRQSDIEAFLQSRTQDAVQREAAVRPASPRRQPRKFCSTQNSYVNNLVSQVKEEVMGTEEKKCPG